MKKKKIILDGYTIQYYKSGRGKQTLLFLHGNSLSSDSFIQQIKDKKLQELYTMYAPDMLGYGDSDYSNIPEEDYTFASQTKRIADFCNILNIDHPIIIGHSLGGNIAIESIRLIDDLQAIILTCSCPAAKPLDRTVFLPHPALPLFFTPELSDKDIEAMNRALFPVGYSEDRVFESALKQSDPKTREVLSRLIEEGNYEDQMQFIEKSDTPIAMIMGKKEQLYNLEVIKTLPLNLFNEQVQIMPTCSHMPFYERPVEFNKLLTSIIANINVKERVS